MILEFRPISSKYIKTLEELKNQSIINAICIHGNPKKAAEVLKITETTIYNFCREYNLNLRQRKIMIKSYQNGNNIKSDKTKS